MKYNLILLLSCLAAAPAAAQMQVEDPINRIPPGEQPSSLIRQPEGRIDYEGPMNITCTQNGEVKVQYEAVTNVSAVWSARMVEFAFDNGPEKKVITVVLSETACEVEKAGP